MAQAGVALKIRIAAKSLAASRKARAMTCLDVEAPQRPLESPMFAKFAKCGSFRGRVRFYTLFDAKQDYRVARKRARVRFSFEFERVWRRNVDIRDATKSSEEVHPGQPETKLRRKILCTGRRNARYFCRVAVNARFPRPAPP